MTQIGNCELSVFRPAWTQANLMAANDLYYCGIKKDYFKRTLGMPGKILKKIEARRNG
jgi:hypothetical protein